MYAFIRMTSCWSQVKQPDQSECLCMVTTTLTLVQLSPDRAIVCEQWSSRSVMYGQLSRVQLSSEQLSVDRRGYGSS